MIDKRLDLSSLFEHIVKHLPRLEETVTKSCSDVPECTSPKGQFVILKSSSFSVDKHTDSIVTYLNSSGSGAEVKYEC